MSESDKSFICRNSYATKSPWKNSNSFRSLALVPAHQPASRCAAERSVQTLKFVLIRQILEEDPLTAGVSLQHRLANFLLMHRHIAHSGTGCAPAELFLKPQLRSSSGLILLGLWKTNRKLPLTELHHRHDPAWYFRHGPGLKDEEKVNQWWNIWINLPGTCCCVKQLLWCAENCVTFQYVWRSM